MADRAIHTALPVGAIDTRASGWWAMIFVVFTEAALFAYLLFSYYYLAVQPHLPGIHPWKEIAPKHRKQGQRHRHQHDENRCRVAVFPAQLGHMGEIHAVNAGHQRRRQEDDGGPASLRLFTKSWLVILLEISAWRGAKNRHCAAMAQENETHSKAGAVIIPVTLFEQNCTLIWCEATKKAVVIDPQLLGRLKR